MGNTPFDEVGILGADSQGGDGQIVIKKYANRRLYNTATSSYVTLDHLARLIQEGVEFVVYDAKSGDDITRSVLTQIIVEEESKGENLLPIAFLRQLISFYGDNMRWMVPQYLEHMIQNFAENQDRMRGAMQDAMGNLFPFGNLEDMRKQNMAFFEQAMRVWSPFSGSGAGSSEADLPRPGQPAARPSQADAHAAQDLKQKEDLARLKSEVQALKAELESMSRKPDAPVPVVAAAAKPEPAVAKPATFESKAPPPAAANTPARPASPAAKAPAKAPASAGRARRTTGKSAAAPKAQPTRRGRPASTRAGNAKPGEAKKD